MSGRLREQDADGGSERLGDKSRGWGSRKTPLAQIQPVFPGRATICNALPDSKYHTDADASRLEAERHAA